MRSPKQWIRSFRKWLFPPPKKVRTQYPFIYIAALRRTGSKVLSRSLTLPPYAFIFQEPGYPRGRFGVTPRTLEAFRELDLNLQKFIRRGKRIHRSKRVENIGRTVFPKVCRVVQQTGVKEIRHEGWEKIPRLFPNLKVIITARDPRDIYLSLAHKWEDRQEDAGFRLNPVDLSLHLLEEFAHQKAMMARLDYMLVRYEDFCRHRALYDRIKEFVRSPIPDIGLIEGRGDGKQHGSEITTLRVCRWKTEENEQWLAEAERTFDLMPEFNEFWGYDKIDGFEAGVDRFFSDPASPAELTH